SVRDIAQTAFASLGLDWQRYVRSEEHLLRPADPVHLCGDASKARNVLGWQPRSSVHELVAEMTHAELARLSSTPCVLFLAPSKVLSASASWTLPDSSGP